VASKITTLRELKVYQDAFETAMKIFEASKSFPREEVYSLTDQIRRSSRSVCANIAEAWRKRRYEAAFINKLSGAEAESAATQVWLEFAVKCGYLPKENGLEFYRTYHQVIRTIVGMINYSETWIIKQNARGSR
jgi:four helix bundle protein